MNIFKTKPHEVGSFSIDEETFTYKTGKKPPYFISNSKGESKCYAVCPACDNPIIIVGLYKHEYEKQEEGETKPHGRHHKGTVAGIAPYDPEEYYNCPLANPKLKGGSSKRPKGNAKSNALYDYLIRNFEYIIYALSEYLGIRISNETAKELLEKFIANEGWEYYYISFFNLPLMLLYTSCAKALVFRWVRIDSPIYDSLIASGLVDLSEENDGYAKVKPIGTEFLDLTFMVCNRKMRVDNEDILECFNLVARHIDKNIARIEIEVDNNAVDKIKTAGKGKNKTLREFATRYKR